MPQTWAWKLMDVLSSLPTELPFPAERAGGRTAGLSAALVARDGLRLGPGKAHSSMMPRRAATVTAWVRSATSSLENMFFR